MMCPTRIDARGKNRGTAVLAYLQETEYQLRYYHEEQGGAPTTRWLGKGAEALGLTDTVTPEAVEQLAHGFDPITGTPLSQTAGREPVWQPKLDAQGQPVFSLGGVPEGKWIGGHRVGFDLCFSICPKSVSVLWADADADTRRDILEAMRASIYEAFTLIEGMLEAPRGQGGVDKIPMAGLVATGFTHFSSRELDPQLHEHVLLYSVGQGADGQFGGFEVLPIFKHQRMISSVAKATFATKLHALGYGIVQKQERDAFDRPTGDVSWELAGVSEAVCERFSTRRQQILAYAREHQTDHQTAALATRRSKEEPPFEQLDALWQDALAQTRQHDPSMFRCAQDLKGLESEWITITDHELLAQLQAKDAVWTKENLMDYLARHHTGRITVPQIVAEAERFLERMAPELMLIVPERSTADAHAGQRSGRRFHEPRYCARAWYEGIEQRMVHIAKARQHEPAQAVPVSTLANALKAFETDRGFGLSEEQRQAVRHGCGPSGIVLISGRAGTGKTVSADVLVRAMKADSREVIAVALSWNAANKLRTETRMDQAFSLAKLLHMLDKGKLELTSRHCVVLDEAGLCDSAATARLMEHCNRSKAKLLMMGDAYQIAPVGAGQAFRLLRDAIGDVELTEIRRQRHEEDLVTSRTFYRHAGRKRGETSVKDQHELGAEIIDRMLRGKQIELKPDMDQAVEQLVADYLDAPEPMADKLILATTNASVRALSQAVRERLVAAGHIQNEQVMTIKRQGRRVNLSIGVGERLRFGRLDRDMDVTNGTTGTVETILATAKGSLVLTVRLDEGDRIVKLDSGTYADLDHAYAMSVDRAQGATVERTFFLAMADRLDVHLGLVAATRAREAFRMYVVDDPELIEQRLGAERLRINALEEGLHHER
jgi:conjugative relaxase-like TrwC/TraI family protein